MQILYNFSKISLFLNNKEYFILLRLPRVFSSEIKGFCGLSLCRNPLLMPTFHESCRSLYSGRGVHQYVSVNSKVHETLPLAMDYDMGITRKPFGTSEQF